MHDITYSLFSEHGIHTTGRITYKRASEIAKNTRNHYFDISYTDQKGNRQETDDTYAGARLWNKKQRGDTVTILYIPQSEHSNKVRRRHKKQPPT
jgi:hypothetical protein